MHDFNRRDFLRIILIGRVGYGSAVARPPVVAVKAAVATAAIRIRIGAMPCFLDLRVCSGNHSHLAPISANSIAR
jgi:hypothetical protein